VLCLIESVSGVTQLNGVVYIVCSTRIFSFNATTHEQLESITVKYMSTYSSDIVACEITSQLYVADQYCVWRISPDGADIRRWLPKSSTVTLTPWSLSVRSGRLLVTSSKANELTQFDADGEELRRVQLPGGMMPHHAVESPTGTFIVSWWNRQLEEHQVIEVNTGGQVLRQFTLSTGGWHRSRFTHYIAVDSHGNIIVVDSLFNCSALVLDARLTLRRVIIDEHQLNYEYPRRLCFVEESGQLLVAGERCVGLRVFGVLRP